MGLSAGDVAAAAARWVWLPDGSRTADGDGWRVVRYPDWAYSPLVLTRFAPDGDPVVALDAALAAARSLAPDLDSVEAVAALGTPPAAADLLAERSVELVEEVDVLALDLTGGPPDLGEPVDGLEVAWTTTPEAALAYNAASVEVFGVTPMSWERAATVAAENHQRLAADRGAGVVVSLDGRPVGTGGLEIAGTDARLYGGGVVADVRGRGVYRALLRHRLDYAAQHGATLAITRGRVATSGPILRRAGFEAFGSERTHRVPLG